MGAANHMMRRYSQSWFVEIYAKLLESVWNVEVIKTETGCFEFTTNRSENRSIILRRYQDSGSPNYVTDPDDPPIVWSLWTPKYLTPLFGYFEEVSVCPSKEGLDFFFSILHRWLIKQEIPMLVKREAKKHPRFFDCLPNSRKPITFYRRELGLLPDELSHIAAKHYHYPVCD